MGDETRSGDELLRDYVEKQDATAFEELYRRHLGFVYSLCFRYLKVRQDAEDAAMACFVVLHMKAKSIQEGKLMAWLHACALRSAWKIYEARQNRLVKEEEASLVDPHANEPASKWEDVLPLVESEMAALPSAQHEVLVLHFYEGLSNAQIAEKIGCPEGTIRSRLDRAIGKLRSRLSRKGCEIEEAAIASGMISTALILPVPAGLELKLAAMAHGEAVAGVVAETAKAVVGKLAYPTAMLITWISIAVVALVIAVSAMIPKESGSTGLPAMDPAWTNHVQATEAATPVRYVDGQIIFQEDFEKPTIPFDLVSKRKGDSKYTAAGEVERKCVYGSTLIGYEKDTVTKAICVELPKDAAFSMGIRRKDPVTVAAYVMEFDFMLRSAGSRFLVAYPESTEARVLSMEKMSIGVGWYRYRVECTPAAGAGNQGLYDIRELINGKFFRHSQVRFDPRWMILTTEIGSVALDNIVIRELAPDRGPAAKR